MCNFYTKCNLHYEFERIKPLFINSHFVMAKLLFNVLIENGYELEYRSFVYGNMQPDWARKNKKENPHNINDSLPYVQSLIYSLSYQRYNRKEYSRKMGNVCHFIADFFTLPHTPLFEGNMRAHMGYEKRLHKVLKNAAYEMDSKDLSDQSACCNAFSLLNKLDLIQKEYLNSASAVPSLELDFQYALKACSLACESILIIQEQYAYRPAFKKYAGAL